MAQTVTVSKGAKTDAAHHAFDVEIAIEVGIPAAVVYRNFVFWIRFNETNRKNFRKGRYWTYNSLTALTEQFPYMSAKQLRTAIDKLVTAGLIVKDQLSNDRYDRRNWYALGQSTSPFGQKVLTEEPQDSLDQMDITDAQNGECIENRCKPVTKPNPQQRDITAEAILESIWTGYPEDRRREKIQTYHYIRAAFSEVTADELRDAVRAYSNESAEFTRSKVCFSDNWFRDCKWRRHVAEAQRKKNQNEAAAAATLERNIMWIKSRSHMCQHLTKSQVEDALQAGLVDISEILAAGISV